MVPENQNCIIAGVLRASICNSETQICFQCFGYSVKVVRLVISAVFSVLYTALNGNSSRRNER